jgi:hypothetical protein
LKDFGEVGSEQEITDRGQVAVQTLSFGIACRVLDAFHAPTLTEMYCS